MHVPVPPAQPAAEALTVTSITTLLVEPRTTTRWYEVTAGDDAFQVNDGVAAVIVPVGETSVGTLG